MGPWAERSAAAHGADLTRPESKLSGSIFDLFADVEMFCAQRGIEPEHREIWEVAAALGVHRLPDQEEDAPELSRAAAPAASDAIAEMVRNHMREQQTGERTEWSPPTPAELAQQRALMGL